MRPDRTRPGRPLRALAALAVLLAGIEIVRLPGMMQDHAGGVAAMAAAGRSAALTAARHERRQQRDAVAASAAISGPAEAARAGDVMATPELAPIMAATTATGASRWRRSAAARVPERTARPARVMQALASVTAAAARAEPPLPASASASASAFDLAATGYARLAAGDRRAAAQAFDAALAAGPAHPNAAAWDAARSGLRRRWSGDAWWLLRQGSGSSVAASPVLGGGQAGASLAYTPDPLARRPLAIVARVAIAALPARRGIAPRGLDGGTAQFAAGLRWSVAPGLSLSGERLFAAKGSTARNDWAVRLAAGTDGRRGRAEWSGYGEAGALGSGDVYAGGQARLALRIDDGSRLQVSAGPAIWASLQHNGTGSSRRVDIGPSLAARLASGRAAVTVSADYRFRIAGNASPGSGPAVTLSAGF